MAQAGHGATIAIELDPVSSPGVFTTVGEQGGDFGGWLGLSRPETDVTLHTDGIDRWIVGVPMREPFTFDLYYVFDDGTHDFETGLGSKLKSGELFGVRGRGPTGTTDTDEWIASGYVTNYAQTLPVREGARTASVTLRFTGPMIIDGSVFD